MDQFPAIGAPHWQYSLKRDEVRKLVVVGNKLVIDRLQGINEHRHVSARRRQQRIEGRQPFSRSSKVAECGLRAGARIFIGCCNSILTEAPEEGGEHAGVGSVTGYNINNSRTFLSNAFDHPARGDLHFEALHSSPTIPARGDNTATCLSSSLF